MTTDTAVAPDPELISKWETIVSQDETIDTGDVSKTIMHRRPFETFRRQTMIGNLPRIDSDRELSEFKITDTLGQGGMGLVRLARQTSLWRDVAIKTIIDEQVDAESTHDLLRESWITGMLEHPNIVPIHALGVDENDAPMLVMKRVEGISWQQALSGQKEIPEPFQGGRDRLENHIQILIQVCNAVQFAHSKGIIHCDLKPENIMLGEFGEVYLLDWGIAVSIEDDESGRLPLASDVTELCGTPAFVPPELAAGEGQLIDERTDVYLLGALLHKIVTGEPRHLGLTVMATLVNAFQSQPVDYDDSVPDELGAICNRATHADINERYPDVEAFRRALLDFLQHRDSQRLSDEARARLETLRDRVEDDDPASGADDLGADDTTAEIYRLFAECRFGFEQALTIWEKNKEAVQGLRQALALMIDFELRHRDAKAAALLIDELPERRPEFEARLAVLREELAQEAKEMQRHKQISEDVDITLASRQRSIMCVFLGFLFGGTPFINHWLIEQGWATLTFQDYFTQFAAISIGAIIVVTLMRKRLFQNAINTRIIISIFIILGGCLIMRVLGFFLGLDPAGCIALENGLLSFGLAMMAASVDHRLWPASLAFLAGAIGGSIYPESILHFDGASNAAALWIIAWVWREPND